MPDDAKAWNATVAACPRCRHDTNGSPCPAHVLTPWLAWLERRRWTQRNEPVGPCVVCEQDAYTDGPDGPQHPTCER